MGRRPIRVMFACHRARDQGGAQQALLGIVEALRSDDRLELVGAVPKPGGVSEALDVLGVPWVAVPTPRWTISVPVGSSAHWSLGELRQRARRVRPIMGSVRPWLAAIDDVGPDVVVSLTCTIPTPAIAARVRRVPHVWWVKELCSRSQGLAYVLGTPVSQRLTGWMSEAVVTNSYAIAHHCSPPIPPAKVSTIYDGLAPDAIAPSRTDADPLRVLLLGRQSVAKGSELAIRAVAMLPADTRVHLRLVGSSVPPKYRDHLARVVAELGVGARVEILDHAARPEEHLEWSNVALMCSVDEGFGRVTAEALLAGRPVIGVRSGATPELVTDGVDGLLVEPGSARAMAAAIGRLADDRELLRSMGAAAVDRNRGRFTVDAERTEFAALLRRVAKAG